MAAFYSVLSTEYVDVPIINPTSNGVAINPTSFAVWMAFMDSTVNNDPASDGSDWLNAIWRSTMRYPYCIGCLIGPLGLAITAGKYNVWVKIDSMPEYPVLQAGQIQIS
jgi:hypothetical protein